MLSVPKRRALADRWLGRLITATSVIVLLLIGGLVVQLIGAALPVLEGSRAKAISPETFAGRRDLSDTRRLGEGNSGGQAPRQPEWLEEYLPGDRTVESGRLGWSDQPHRRVWVQLDSRGRLAGEILSRGEDGATWLAQSLEGFAAQDGAIYVDLLAGGDWLWLLWPDGSHRLVPVSSGLAPSVTSPKTPGSGTLDAPPEQASPTAASLTASPRLQTPLDSTRVLQRAAYPAWFLVASDRVSHLHVVWVEGRPQVRLLRSLTIPEGITQARLSPDGRLLLVHTGDDEAQIWHLTSGRIWHSIALAGYRGDSAGPLSSPEWLDDSTLMLPRGDEPPAVWQVNTAMAEASLTALFGETHYEGYEEARNIWQPTGADQNYAPKLNLWPLIVGTLKAAFTALVIGMPLAVGAAIFVGFFLTPSLRDRIKPAIESMAAFPTVVVGAVAAVWLAPRFLEGLVPLATVLVSVPATVALLAMIWRFSALSLSTRQWLPRLPLLLVPVLLLLIPAFWQVGGGLESLFFGGAFADWLFVEYGIPAQHRNVLLVGIALGFAVTPTIFSVAEDAIYAVPRQAAAGSLALGASQWQSFREVVLPVALPGIIAGIMLGFGRAMGETMILLLLAGNTPLDNLNLLEGVRSISATLAIELPNSSVGSVHFHVLFLAALLLFVFTFISNTGAQLLKRYLRRHHGLQL